MARRLLVVDDDPVVLEALSEALTAEGLEVATAESAEAALRALSRERPDLVLSDVRMPVTDGLELLRLLKERAPSVDVVMMTAYEDMPTVVAAMQEGASDFLTKPLNLAALRSVVGRVLRDRRIRGRSRKPEVMESVDDPSHDMLVGRHPSMIHVYKRIGQLSTSRVTVLVRGETGTGKELVARAIHHNSPWSDEPFVAMNCSAVPEGLLESELFGHVRGAFTGAVADRRGRFALAGRGTLFLDEIADTTLAFQARLLRVLEERRFVPVGAESDERAEARVIAATHGDLESEIAEGRFREDLYYRLKVVEIFLPPLRERAEDIPVLARHLVRKAGARLDIEPPHLSEAAEEALLRHDWPGNVRELENCLTRAVALRKSDVIQPTDLDVGTSDASIGFEPHTLEELEGEHVARVLRSTGGNKTRTAEILGVSRPRLYRLIEKHGLEP